VAQFIRIMSLILKDINPEMAKPFIDDIGVKRPYINYDREEALLSIRRFILKYI
jgi:hypothetical protein